ncbi:hypothetical protein QEG98_19595 [Myxococcus sp. MxC21-1]|uniref:hypothetical protein n=1 Tax=Myxococcus sp. MxC21-1 TaxID=3041439 RepID=UPI00292F0F4F|nr:hypothetical protein [Myxococcus sp. MxC21-1]WNZ65617.1 hypothetical protein QEG98_19595 [Myxococcus sp. MxC21-1]
MRLSLTHKITLAPIVVALLFVLLTQGYTVPRLQEAFEAQGRELSGALPTVLAAAVADGMKRSAHDEVQQTLDAVARHGGAAYVAAFDAGGTLVGVAGEKAQMLRDAREQLRSSEEGSSCVMGTRSCRTWWRRCR